MKNLISSLNKGLKYLAAIVVTAIVLLVIALTGCNFKNGDEYTFEFTPNSITKDVGNTFNVFSLSYDTNLPSNIKNNLETYEDVEISAESEGVVNISLNTNEITTITAGSTKINIVINYNNVEINSSFNLTISNSSTGSTVPDNSEKNPNTNTSSSGDEENETPPVENTFNKGKLKGDITYSYEVDDGSYEEEGYICYTLILSGSDDFSKLKFEVVNKEYKDFIDVYVCGYNIRYLYVYTDEDIEVSVLQDKNVNIGKIILKSNI